MNRQNTLTGERKMMNMAELGIVLQAAKSFESTENPMNTGLRAIHYANFMGGLGGTVGGSFTHAGKLKSAPFFAPNCLNPAKFLASVRSTI